MASACTLLMVMAAMAAVVHGEFSFKLQDLPARMLEAADINLDGKATLQEALDLVYAMFYKFTADELTVLDTDNNGVITTAELQPSLADLKRLFDYIDPNHLPGKLSAKTVLDFLTKHGVEFGNEPDSNQMLGADTNGNLDAITVEGLLLSSGFFHFIDRAMVRYQLGTHGINRLLTSNNEIEGWFSRKVTFQGSWSTDRFVGAMKGMRIVFDSKDFGKWITPNEIRRVNVTRKTIGWPTPDLNGNFLVNAVAAFGELYGLGLQNFIAPEGEPRFDVVEADEDKDGYLSPTELQRWLGDSASALLDGYFVDVMTAGVKHLLKRVANLLERFVSQGQGNRALLLESEVDLDA